MNIVEIRDNYFTLCQFSSLLSMKMSIFAKSYSMKQQFMQCYEEVIDAAIRAVEKELKDVPRGMGFCIAFWSAKNAALASCGAQWRAPHLMKPRIIFD